MSAPSIEGTYQLVRREFPDGTIQLHPDIHGMMSFTRGFRNFSVLWQDEDGRFYSECYVARYTLTEAEYSETSEYLIVDDQIGGKDIRYDLSNTTASSPVTINDGRISFDLPQEFERQLSIRVEFDGPQLSATLEGLFVDYWKMVP